MTIDRRRLSRALLFILLVAALLFATSALLAQIATRSGERIDAADVLPDVAFFAAGELAITAKSTDDIFAAGGDVSIAGAQADHMFVAGGDILVTDSAFHDLIATGGDLDLVSGTITDDLIAAGGGIKVQSSFSINGSAVLAGGSVSIAAPIGGELRAAGARIRLNGPVEGDARLTGEEVLIGPDARIGGDLRHRARKIEIDPAAVVSGRIIALEPPPRPDFEKWGVKAAAAIALFALAFLFGMGLLIIVIAVFLPALMSSASAMMRAKPLAALGIGFLVTVAAPAVIAILFATILGIPLALLIAVLWAASAPLAIAAAAYFIGMTARGAMTKAAAPPGGLARAAWSALAVLILAILGLIPILGGLLWAVAYVIGLGAVMTRGGKALAVKA